VSARRGETINRVVGTELALRVCAQDHFIGMCNGVSALQINIANSTPVTHFLENSECNDLVRVNVEGLGGGSC